MPRTHNLGMTSQGIVDIPLRAAEATDPEGLALRPDIGPENARARARREACYSHILGVLKTLSDPAAAAVAAPTAAAGGAASAARKPPSAAERAAYRTRLLKVRPSCHARLCTPLGVQSCRHRHILRGNGDLGAVSRNNVVDVPTSLTFRAMVAALCIVQDTHTQASKDQWLGPCSSVCDHMSGLIPNLSCCFEML